MAAPRLRWFTAVPAVLLALPAVATAGPADGPVGRKCGFNSMPDVTSEAGRHTAVVSAGPLYTGEAGTLVCTIVVNGNTHSATNGTSIRARATADSVVVLHPTAVSYGATAADTVTMCTAWVPDSGPALYWGTEHPPYLGRWSTGPHMSCTEAQDLEPDDPACPFLVTVDKYAGTPLAEIWQDCERYPPIF